MGDEVAKAQQAGGEEDTIFGKIARGEIPCEFLYQDDQVNWIISVSSNAAVAYLKKTRQILSFVIYVHLYSDFRSIHIL